MSDNRFSLDDILKEHPSHEKSSSAGEPFNLDEFLSSSYKVEDKGQTNGHVHEDTATKNEYSSIASELYDAKKENSREFRALTRQKEKLKRVSQNTGEINIVLGQQDQDISEFKKQKTFSFHNRQEQRLDAFETIEKINSKEKKNIKKTKKENPLSVHKEKKENPLQDKPKIQKAAKPKQKITKQDVHEFASEPNVTLKNQEKTVAEDKDTVKSLWKEATGFIEGIVKKNDDDAKMSFEGKGIRAVNHNTMSGNTEIIDNLMRIKKERGSRTSLLKPIPRKSINDIDLNLDDIILPNTEQIPINEDEIEIRKFKELKERRKEKVNKFVLVGNEEEEDEEKDQAKEEDREITDFEKFEDAPSILNDIVQLKGSLIVRLCLLLVTTIASVYISFANDFDLPIMEILNKNTQPTTYLFINIILGLLSAFVSYTVISCGLIKFVKFQADCDSISAIAVISSLLSAMVTLANPGLVSTDTVHVYISVAIASLMFNTIGKLLIVGRTARNFKYISGDYERYAVFAITDEEKASSFTRGTINDFPNLVSMKKSEFITDFLKHSYSTDLTDKFCKIAVPLIALASLVIAVISVLLNGADKLYTGLFIGLSDFAGCISICCCFSVMLIINLPMYRACKKYLEKSAAVLSYQSVEEFSDANSVLLDVSQIFPQGMVNLSAIKVFSDTRIDEAIVEAASLTNQAGSILKNMFYDIIAGKTEMLNPVESYIYEDSMGICGWIDNKRVLLGNRELMTNHSIEGMPTVQREKEYTQNGKSAVYLSISGELSAMFIVELKASSEVQKYLKLLEKNRVYVMLRSVDSIISINKIAELFEISPDMLKIIPFRLHQSYEEVTSYTPKESASMACIGRFASFASLVVGVKRIKSITTMGMGIQTASIILGLLMALTFSLMSNFGILTPSAVLFYNFMWTSIILILQGIRRT